MAMLEPQVKQERFNARLSEEQKAILQRAADLQGMSLTDFVLSSAHDEALRIIEAHEIIRLSQRDSEAFLQALESPPAASKHVIERFVKAGKHRA
ncbi:MAG TPA: DUF1778 domain-containing protein [Candidatus Baltobacteraceae bacterium]